MENQLARLVVSGLKISPVTTYIFEEVSLFSDSAAGEKANV